ncbi:MAG: ATP-binding cassette domain-containing protein [Ilumatobacteraceae bacterium]|jgi:iron complex transport system ATP-binding protein|nr:ATP-binding cassette domain-containing protein [Ilumatobacteraceae bacterium]
MAPPDPPPLDLAGIGFDRAGRTIIGAISLRVERDQRWVVLGPNGCGKTTLVRIAALMEHPTRGTVTVLGEQLGHTDVRVLRRRIGWASAALARQLRPDLTATDVVMTARHAALEPWWHRYDDHDRRRAADCLGAMGLDGFGERTFGTLSSGEQQRTLLARTMMNEPAVVLLDEPGAGLDLAGREHLVDALDHLAAGVPFVLVTHHVDEIPGSATHALVMRDGAALAQGPIDEVVDDEHLSAAFGLPLRVERDGGRFSVRARR